MIEILLMLIGVLALAKHPRKKRFRRYMRGNVDLTLSFSGLAASAMDSVAFDDSVSETSWCSSIVAMYSLNKWTPVATAGPIVFGVAHSDYTAPEIEAWLEQADNWSLNDLVAREISSRKIKKIGMFQHADLATGNASFRGGREVTTKLGWMLETGQTLRLWVYNTGQAAQITTTATVEAHGHVNLWPR